ncbi:hypothetical protein D9613_001803 [Agrocybe pediades]|uniref:Uncharacterized protein n=1 Tax=Agrocybe pediades TaxID=84607 RepID=A0A8H4R7X6_9AGAR|nr:hypothetical protein D9613_001803 [Agrocybe pediades]
MHSANHISIPLGIVIGLLASFVQSLGLTIQRKSHVQNQALPEHRQTLEHRRPLWLLGFAIFISSNVIGSFVQIASLPVVILAPLGAVSLLWNAFFARLLLGDVFSPWMILGTILIAGGAILIAFFGIVPEQTRSLEDLLSLFRRPTFIVYFSILGVVVFVSLVVTHVVEFSLARRLRKDVVSESSSADPSPTSSTINLPTQSANLTTGLTDTLVDTTLVNEQTPLIDPKAGSLTPQLSPSLDGNEDKELRSVRHTRLFLAISYASFSGIISGMCLLFAKSGVELLLLTLGGKNQFWRWEAWVLVLGLIIFAILQLWYLHKALILADPTLVCPSAFCFYNLSSIVNGLVYFDQFSLIPPLHLCLVVLGIIVLLGGVWVVSIQSGGGGVDVGTWNEEGVKLAGEDIALYTDAEANEADGPPLSAADAVPLTRQSETYTPTKQGSRIGAVPMERETRSESNLPNVSTTPFVVESSSDAAYRDLEHVSSPTQSSFTSPSRPHRTGSQQLYSTPRTPSHRSRRRPTADGVTSPPTHHQHHQHSHHHHHPGHSRTSSYPAPLSPPLSGTVSSTLGTGFQIGLSPLSPGFTIMPLERRRPSLMTQSGTSSSFADVAGDVVGSMRRERRRTVSEGEVGTRSPRTSGLIAGGEGLERSEERVDASDDPFGGTTRTQDDVLRGEGNPARRRWRWLRNVFGGKR